MDNRPTEQPKKPIYTAILGELANLEFGNKVSKISSLDHSFALLSAVCQEVLP